MASDNPEQPVETVVEQADTTGQVTEMVAPTGAGPWKRQLAKHPRGTLYRFVASELRMSPEAIRFWDTRANQDKIAEFEKSILENGIQRPLKVSYEENPEGLFTIEDGDTRYIAVRRLEGFDVLSGRPCEARRPPDHFIFEATSVNAKRSEIDRLIDKAIANSGRDFTDLEWAGLIHRLMTKGDGEETDGNLKGMPQQEIASRLGKPASWVSRIHKLNDISPRLQSLLRDDRIRTTTLLDKIDEYGEEELERVILAEIEAGKGQAAFDYEEAMAEVREGSEKIAELLASGNTNDIIGNTRDRRSLPPLEIQQRRVTQADARAQRAKETMERGPARITSRALTERKQRTARATTARPAAPAPAAPAPETAPEAVSADTDFTRSNYAALRDAVEFAAANSREPKIRDRMNEVLKRCGYEEVEPCVDDDGNELPPVDDAEESAVA